MLPSCVWSARRAVTRGDAQAGGGGVVVGEADGIVRVLGGGRVCARGQHLGEWGEVSGSRRDK